MPKRTIALLGLLSVLTIVDFDLEWKYGVEYRGERHTILLYIINLTWLTFLWWSAVRSRRQPSFMRNLLSHWLLFAWLGGTHFHILVNCRNICLNC